MSGITVKLRWQARTSLLLLAARPMVGDLIYLYEADDRKPTIRVRVTSVAWTPGAKDHDCKVDAE